MHSLVFQNDYFHAVYTVYSKGETPYIRYFVSKPILKSLPIHGYSKSQELVDKWIGEGKEEIWKHLNENKLTTQWNGQIDIHCVIHGCFEDSGTDQEETLKSLIINQAGDWIEPDYFIMLPREKRSDEEE